MTSKASRAAVYIVGAPRPRIGKTLLARLAADYARTDGRQVSVFDINPHDPVISEYFPRSSRVIDIQQTADQMALFDALVRNDGVTKVVDIGHMSFQRFFTLAEQIDAFTEMRRHRIEVITLMLMDLHSTTRDAFADLTARFPDSLTVPVENVAVAPFPRDIADGQDTNPPFRLPPLHLGLRPFVANPNRSFFDFHDGRADGVAPATALKLQEWTREVFLAFRELELGLLLRKLRSSLLKAS